jgi:hypothetical protein
MEDLGEMAGIKVFLSYAHRDEALQKEFAEHLGALKREGIIQVWWDHQIPLGSNWDEEISRELETADLILLLVSPSFLNSPFCYEKEMRRAVERHKAGGACVIPIILRACHWEPAPFAQIQGMPKNMKPVTSWPKGERDAVWAEIAKGIHQAAKVCAARQEASTGSFNPKGFQDRFKEDINISLDDDVKAPSSVDKDHLHNHKNNKYNFNVGVCSFLICFLISSAVSIILYNDQLSRNSYEALEKTRIGLIATTLTASLLNSLVLNGIKAKINSLSLAIFISIVLSPIIFFVVFAIVFSFFV